MSVYIYYMVSTRAFIGMWSNFKWFCFFVILVLCFIVFIYIKKKIPAIKAFFKELQVFVMAKLLNKSTT